MAYLYSPLELPIVRRVVDGQGMFFIVLGDEAYSSGYQNEIPFFVRQNLLAKDEVPAKSFLELLETSQGNQYLKLVENGIKTSSSTNNLVSDDGKNILTFVVAGGTTYIDYGTNKVYVSLPANTPVTAIAATATFSVGASSNVNFAVPADYTGEVSAVITGSDLLTRTWKIYILPGATVIPSTSLDIVLLVRPIYDTASSPSTFIHMDQGTIVATLVKGEAVKYDGTIPKRYVESLLQVDVVASLLVHLKAAGYKEEYPYIVNIDGEANVQIVDYALKPYIDPELEALATDNPVEILTPSEIAPMTSPVVVPYTYVIESTLGKVAV